MNLSKDEREAVAKSEKILSVIGNELNEKNKTKSKINVEKIAKQLAARRESVQSE